MTVETTHVREPLQFRVLATDLSFPFTFDYDQQPATITVYEGTTIGGAATLVDPARYTVTPAVSPAVGGTVDFTAGTAPPIPSVIYIVRAGPYVQATDYETFGQFQAASHEAALDTAAFERQERLDRSNGALRLPAYEDPANYLTELPNVDGRADKVVGFNSGGQLVMLDPGSGGGGTTYTGYNGIEVDNTLDRIGLDTASLPSTTVQSDDEISVRRMDGTYYKITATQLGGGGGSGEINDGANVGTGDGQVFRDKTGTTLNFRRFIGAGGMTITTGADDVTFDQTHVHPISDVTGLQAELDGKAPLVHTHVIADVTGLQVALDAKLDSIANVGSAGGAEVLRNVTGATVNARKIVQGTDISVVQSGDDIIITNTNPGGGGGGDYTSAGLPIVVTNPARTVGFDITSLAAPAGGVADGDELIVWDISAGVFAKSTKSAIGGGAGGGSDNNGVELTPAGPGQVFAGMSGNDLTFRTLAGAGGLAVTQDASIVTLDATHNHAGTYLTQVQDDTSPRLGGNLDGLFNIVLEGAAGITRGYRLNNSSQVENGGLTYSQTGDVVTLFSADGARLAIDGTGGALNWPVNSGTNEQVLHTDGGTNMFWQSVAPDVLINPGELLSRTSSGYTRVGAPTSDRQYLRGDPGAGDGLQWTVHPMDKGEARGDLMPATGAGGAYGRLLVGNNGDVLEADSVEAVGMKWVAPPWIRSDLITTKGDVIVYSAQGNAPARLPVGATDQVLTVDPTPFAGIAWKNNPGSELNALGDLLFHNGLVTNRLPVGTAGQVLEADPGNAGVRWVNPTGGGAPDILTTKGDILTRSASDYIRFPVGATDGHVLTVAAGQASGLEWAAAPAGSLSGPMVNDIQTEGFKLDVRSSGSVSRGTIGDAGTSLEIAGVTAVNFSTPSVEIAGTKIDRLADKSWAVMDVQSPTTFSGFHTAIRTGHGLSITGVRHHGVGTSGTFAVLRNGVAIAGLTSVALSIGSSATTAITPVALADGDRIELDFTAASGLTRATVTPLFEEAYQ